MTQFVGLGISWSSVTSCHTIQFCMQSSQSYELRLMRWERFLSVTSWVCVCVRAMLMPMHRWPSVPWRIAHIAHGTRIRDDPRIYCSLLYAFACQTITQVFKKISHISFRSSFLFFSRLSLVFFVLFASLPFVVHFLFVVGSFFSFGYAKCVKIVSRTLCWLLAHVDDGRDATAAAVLCVCVFVYNFQVKLLNEYKMWAERANSMPRAECFTSHFGPCVWISFVFFFCFTMRLDQRQRSCRLLAVVVIIASYRRHSVCAYEEYP